MAAPLSLRCDDGFELAAQWHQPPVRTGPTVLLAGALAVPQRFYAAFATWLAEQGHGVLTFDVRGIGASRPPGGLRGLQADMLSWARVDFAAAVQAAHERAAGGPLVVLGHSLGTHHALMTGPATQARITRVLSVAAGAGSWRDWAGPSRRLAPLMLHGAGPLLVPLLGWFPGRRLRMVGDLPAGVMRQWSRWCRHPGFAWGAEPEAVRPALQAARFALHALSFSDDEAMTQQCTRQLLAAAPIAKTSLEVVTPEQFGLRAIGHLGAFRPAMRNSLWPLLQARLAGGATLA